MLIHTVTAHCKIASMHKKAPPDFNVQIIISKTMEETYCYIQYSYGTTQRHLDSITITFPYSFYYLRTTVKTARIEWSSLKLNIKRGERPDSHMTFGSLSALSWVGWLGLRLNLWFVYLFHLSLWWWGKIKRLVAIGHWGDHTPFTEMETVISILNQQNQQQNEQHIHHSVKHWPLCQLDTEYNNDCSFGTGHRFSTLHVLSNHWCA